MGSSSGIISIYDVLVATTVSAIHYFVTNLYYKAVPEPYMDEVFHVPQARAYCDGNYSQFDPMITTPPLLYILTVLFGCCRNERYFNSMMIGFCYLAAMRYGRKQTNSRASFPALAIVFLPVLFQTSCLYYTDMLSLLLVLCGLATESTFTAAVIFTASCLSRQTNIIWAAFYCFCNLIKFLRTKDGNALTNTVTCILIHWPFAFLGAGFMGFIYWNDGSMVLGDKTAHHVHPHIPQIYYFLFFGLVSSVPNVFPRIKSIMKASWHYRYHLVVSSLVMGLTIHLFSYNHPYLLADNRHFVFYLWRKWMLRHFLCKYLLVPLYIVSVLFFLNSLNATDKYVVYALLVCTSLTVVPAHLVEFRYFIIPYSIWRLNMNQTKSSIASNVIEIAIHMGLNVATIYLFLYRPFEWSHEPGKMQRFMW